MKLKRIYILGGTGAGKTTFANQLSKKLKLKVYSTDNFVYKKLWSFKFSEKQKENNLKKIAKKDKWIIEGIHSGDWIIPAIKRADLIIFLKTNRIIKIKRIIKRSLKERNSSIKDLFMLIYSALISKKSNLLKIKQTPKCIILKNKREISKFIEKLK